MGICVKLIILFFGLLGINALADKLSEQKLEFNKSNKANKANKANKVIVTINIKENNLKLDFKIICLKGYQYLYLASSGDNPTQMFSKDRKSKQSVPVSCNGFEDE